MPTDVERSTIDPATKAITDRNLKLSFDFARQILADPSILDDIPDGVNLVLLLEDDPEFDEVNITLGLDTLRRGRDVYFRYVRERPVTTDESEATGDRARE